MKFTRFSVTYLLFVLLYACVYAGFFFHRSVHPLVGNYSGDYLLLLVLLAIPFLIPLLLRWLYCKLGRRRFQLLTFLTCIFMITAYAITSMTYYQWVRHKPPFDPYLQARPVAMDASRLEQLQQQRSKPDRPFLIITLGGSTSLHYPELLLNELRRQYPNRSFELLNLAQNSYTVKHALIRYCTHFDQWQPDLVIGLFGINEMIRSFSPEGLAVGPYDDEWSHFFYVAYPAVRLPTLESRIYDRLQFSWYRSLRVHEVDSPLDAYRARATYGRHLKRLCQWMILHNTPCLLMTQPTLYKTDNTEAEKNTFMMQKVECLVRHQYFHQEYPSSATLSKVMHDYNQTLLHVSGADGVQSFDLDRAIPKSLDYLYDDCHYTVKGNRLVVETMIKALVKKKLLKDQDVKR
ncbi:MAG: hypothetical protein JNJ77_04510 [Planctomycetia bacterium]|nr:hypothetical protein [Planctomycetia bacterium]